MAGKKARKAEKKALKAEKKAEKKARKAEKKAAKAGQASHKARVKSAKVAKAPKKAGKIAVAAPAQARAHQDRRKPESLRLRSAGPSFTVSDLDRSLAFYRDVLGFTAGETWEEDGKVLGVELVAGSVTFWLGQDDWKKGRDRVKGQGFRMYCTTSQDIDAFAERVKAGGGTIVDEPKDQPWGGRAFAVKDDDGFVITFASA
jgi:uncharacterized glyoxalase superfamily protein PhnB